MKSNAIVEVRTITPELATEWLDERWGEQRSVRLKHVERLASDMTAGRFKLGSDAILRVNGKLANGQHRLSAVIASGKPQQFIVLESDDENLYKVIDAGLRRTVGDGLIGTPYATMIPSFARWVQAYDTKTIRRGSRAGCEAGKNAENNPTQIQLIDYCREHHEILSEAARFVVPLYESTRLLPCSIAGALYVIASSRDGLIGKAKEFLQAVYVDGGKNSAGDLRNRLIAAKGGKSPLNAGYVFGITIKAFSAYSKGIRPGVLRWSKDEEFQQI